MEENEEDFWYDDNKKILIEAMLEAEKAFNEFINEKLNLDGAYWELELTGYVLSTYNFSRIEKVEMKKVEEVDDND